MSNTKISFISLGCDKNLIDSEIMLGLIDEKGYEIVSDESEADIVIINSCGFIMDANEEAIENILRVADYKKEGKCKGIIVTGCMAQRYKDEIFKELPEVDAVVGTGDFENIVSVIDRICSGEKSVQLITDKDHIIDPKNSLKRIVTSPGGFSYLKIAEGCDNFCTYCTIPYLRGKYRSRPLESLVEEARNLASQGVRELILIAQDTSLYGIDLYGEKKLPLLLEKLSEIEDIEWIRILYCYPEHITDEIIDAMANTPKVCHYLDMPIQHSDNKILKLMGRRSTREGLIDVIGRLRTKMPDICLRTTLIVGFPTETEENFKALCDFISEVKFDRLGVFTYSREEGTPAYKMDGQIDEEIKQQRKDYILEMQKGISAEKCSSFIGKTLKVIVEGKIGTEENAYCARSYRDCYEIDGFVFFESEEELIAGDFYNIKITDSSDYDLIGAITDEPTE
ncbi:MAG: 30S ribosomal protein S12 methylthiotransferase RimO [Firmicutes bacterium]|nr:30S ribosomal protein S12 methylthiotransferase RimO [Bacillota bacterium]